MTLINLSLVPNRVNRFTLQERSASGELLRSVDTELLDDIA